MGDDSKKSLVPVVHAGFLVKQGKIVKNWKLRYFELGKDNVLRYYRTAPRKGGRQSTSEDLAGSIKLEDCSAILTHEELPDVDWPERIFPLYSRPAHCFGLKTPGRTYYLCGEHVNEIYRWKLEISRYAPAIENVHPERPDKPSDKFDNLDKMLMLNPALQIGDQG